MRIALCVLLAAALVFALVGCSVQEAVRAARVAATGDVAGAQRIATEKAVRYAANPKALMADLNRFKQILETFRKAVGGEWGERERREPRPKEYVKYTQNYKSRALVDFDAGMVTVETVDQADAQKSLESAIVTTLLTPNDPRAVDLYSAGEIKLVGEPFLYEEVVDHQGKPIRWSGRAEKYAQWLIANKRETRRIAVEGKQRTVQSVAFPMVKDHLQVRAAKFRPQVARWAKQYGVSGNLVYAVMRTESNFNPYAVSHVPAFGLMQIVPKTAGRDVYRFLHGKDGLPTRDELFTPDTNVRYGSAYLHILDTRYLAGVANPVSREYCMIAAYNGGSGTVLKTFHKDKSRALAAINKLKPLEVYETLRTKVPYDETRRYLVKVTSAKKEFVKF